MTRALTAGFASAIQSDAGEMVHLVELDFSSGNVYICTAASSITWNGQTWTAVGGALSIGPVEETSDGRSQGVEVRLSGVDQTILSVLLNNKYRGRPVKVYRARIDPLSGNMAGGAPLLLFQGLQLNPYKVEEARSRKEGTVTISSQYLGLFGVPRIRGIQSNLASHQHEFPGDTFFQFAALLSSKKIYWGTQAPMAVGTSNKPTGGGGQDTGVWH